MLAPTEVVSSPTKAADIYFDLPAFDSSSSTVVSSSQRSLRRHKILPHPRGSSTTVARQQVRPPSRLAIDTGASSSESGSHTSSPLSLRPQAQRVGGPDPPPTPPAHSRNSSSSHSVLPSPSSPTYIGTPVGSASSLSARIPGTPSNQRSPPTPDVTPPRQPARSKISRPLLSDRVPSKATTADSRTESFKTAREDPYSSDDDGRATLRPAVVSRRASQNTVELSTDTKQKRTKAVGLGLGLESDDNLTPRTKQEFFTFDGEWGGAVDSNSDVEQEWDENLFRNVTVRKRRNKKKPTAEEASRQTGTMREVVEDVMVAPTNATKVLRSISLHDNPRLRSPPHASPARAKRWTTMAAPLMESASSNEVKRASGVSSRSTVSTVVEAILLDVPPQRQKTLRHVKKHTSLRDSPRDSPISSTANSTSLDEAVAMSKYRPAHRGPKTESFASSATVSSLASRKARRDVWKSGGIPVVVIPDRRASMKPANTPSLRSTSSRRSQSLSSVPLSSLTRAKETTPVFERSVKRGRTLSESDGSLPGDQRTMDYPPIVPIRSSSLSAPTSRNNSRSNSLAGSRTASLTAESLKAHNALVEQQMRSQTSESPVQHAVVPDIPDVEYIPADEDHVDENQPHLTPSVASHKDAHDRRSLVDHNGDPFFGKRLTAHNTPFSLASVDTNGTHSAAEVSEAMAVNIYPHQNKSVVMVDHTSRSSDTNAMQGTRSSTEDEEVPEPVFVQKPTLITTGPDGEALTPPQPRSSLSEVDSPLRNPRPPPQPPAIKLTPATPSGFTPAADKMKMLGNYFEQPTEKRPSLVRRAFSLRKSSDDGPRRPSGLLLRTLSLTRNTRKDTTEIPDLSRPDDLKKPYPTADDPPVEEGKLHPFWRPASSLFDPENDEDWVYDIPDEVDQIYQYPDAGSRPMPPRRSLSARMKRTFAILPVNDDDYYGADDSNEPERRTIKRTPSGNLRVMRYRDSYSSLRWGPRPASARSQMGAEEDGRPSTVPDRAGRRAWGVEKRTDARGRRLFPGWQDKFGQYGLQNLQRRLSEHKRQKRSEMLRQKISGPREVRDSVGEVIKRRSYKGPSYQTASGIAAGRSNQTEGYE